MAVKIVPIDHSAVPKNVRDLVFKISSATELNTQTNVRISNEEGQISNQKESMLTVNKEQRLREPQVNKGTPVQKDMESYVKITKQSFEEKMINTVE